MKPRLTPELVVDMRDRWAAGETVRTLAGAYGVSIGCVLAVVTRRTWITVGGGWRAENDRGDYRQIKLTDDHIEYARERRRRGHSYAAIANSLGVTDGAIKYHLAGNGRG